MNPLKKILLSLGLIPDPQPPKPKPNEVWLTATMVGKHVYAIKYRADQQHRICEALGLWACNPNVPFTFPDAARMLNEIEQERTK